MEYDTLDQDYLHDPNWSTEKIKEINLAIQGFNMWGRRVRWGHYMLLAMAVVYLIIGLVIYQSAQYALYPEVGVKLGQTILVLAAVVIVCVLFYRRSPAIALILCLGVYLFTVFQSGATFPGQPRSLWLILKLAIAAIFLYLLYSTRVYNARQKQLAVLGFAPSHLNNAWRALKSLRPVDNDR